MIVTKKAIPRRTVLRGAGAMLALPLLDAMVPAFTAVAKTAAAPVKRFGAFYVPNGMSIGKGHWTPATTGPDFELTTILQPWAKFRDRLTIISGMTNHAAIGQVGEGAGDHARGPACYLTGVHVKKTEGGDYRAGTSLDQYMAQKIGTETLLPSLELGMDSIDFVGACDPGYSCVYQATISWKTPTVPLPMENDPRAVFERLFGADGTTDPKARLARIAKSKSVLDALTGSVSRLQQDLGTRDKEKIDQYLEAVRDAERRLEKAEKQNVELPVIPRPTGIPESFEDHIKLQFDLLTLAFQADITRIFTFLLAKEMGPHAYPGSGVPEAHHGVSHHQSKEERLAKLARINTYHTYMYAYLVDKLATTPYGDAMLLDDTILNYGAGISNSDQHTHVDLPIALISGKRTGIKGGQHIRTELHTPLTNMHMTLLDKMGVPMESFGDSTGKLEGLSL
jgi:hypothetical protein